jgi:NTP pyrophosphatase (non-canonical NTP hydrolase)
MNREDELMALAVEKWGVDSQVTMAIEEMAELTKALCKMKRQDFAWGTDKTRPAWNNMAEEIADVYLCLKQLEYMFEITATEKRKAEKLDRLAGLLLGYYPPPPTEQTDGK